MTFALSQHSLDRLVGVHPKLVAVVKTAITESEIDFGVSCGVRTLEQQKELMAKGVSWTLKSQHLPQDDGFGHAVDLVAYIGGQITWKMPHYAQIAEAMMRASNATGIQLTWGAVWDRPLSALDLHDGLDNDIEDYIQRFQTAHGRRPHLDGPHFQLRDIS